MSFRCVPLGVFTLVSACSSSGGNPDGAEDPSGTAGDDSSESTPATTDDSLDTSADDTGPPGSGEPFMPGPVGDPASATIGPDGGSITSSDGRLSLVFPAGALASDTLVEVQQVEYTDGFAWELRPDGLELAMPVVATITLAQSEAGEVVASEVEGVSSIELPLFQSFHANGNGLEEVASTLTWREEDAELDWTLELTHFSWVGMAGRAGAGAVTSQYAAVVVGNTLVAGVSYSAPPFETKPLVVSCPDPRTIMVPHRNVINSVEVVIDDAEVLEKIGGVEMTGSLDAAYGYRQELRCATLGSSGGALRWTISTELMAGADLGSCTLPPGRTFFEFDVNCVAPCTGDDPVDVGQVADGDPALDLLCVKTGVLKDQDGQYLPWVRVTFDGPWRPPEAYWSWFSRVSFKFSDGSNGAFVTEHHLPSIPADSQFTEGTLQLADVTYTEEATGYLLVLSDVYTIESVAVESGLQKVPPPEGVFVPDQIPAVPFDETSMQP